MSGSAGLSAAKNRRTRGGLSQPSTPSPLQQQSSARGVTQAQMHSLKAQQQTQPQQQQQKLVRLSPIQVLQKHEVRLREIEKASESMDLEEDITYLRDKVDSLENSILRLTQELKNVLNIALEARDSVSRMSEIDHSVYFTTDPTPSSFLSALPSTEVKDKKQKKNNVQLEIGA
jgi:hypothetical protein